ncbi:MAG: hypothetical protein GOU99_01905 [Candidatus Altiarchaeota archaeon]|nr:hypothetical protein [Candidatus Altiarchaeota archaeon]
MKGQFDLLVYPLFLLLLLAVSSALLTGLKLELLTEQAVFEQSRRALDVSAALVLATAGPLPTIVSFDHILNQTKLDALTELDLAKFGLASLSINQKIIGEPSYFVYRLVLNQSRPHLLVIGTR